MKSLIIIFIVFVAVNANAQVLITKIKFSYDAAGNRTKREIIIEPPSSSERHANSNNSNPTEARLVKETETALDLTKASADLYPNPAKEFVIVNFTRGEEKAEAKLMMFDMQGKAVGEQKLENGINTITINQLKPANYLFRVVCGNYNEDWQVVKQN
jgi:hypothetical protein